MVRLIDNHQGAGRYPGIVENASKAVTTQGCQSAYGNHWPG